MDFWCFGVLTSPGKQLGYPCKNMHRQIMLLLVQTSLLLAMFSTSHAQETHDSENLYEGASSHWMHVRKCCPQAHIMVEVANRLSTKFVGHGSKFECQMPNETTFRWAPDFLDEKGNLVPFVENYDFEEAADVNDINITTLCVSNGPCISPIIGKPECGPLRAWPIFTYAGFQEELQLRPQGVLRHVIDKHGDTPLYYEYQLDQYCIDSVRLLGSVSHFGHGLPKGAEDDTGIVKPPTNAPIFYGLICEPSPLTESEFFVFFVRILYPTGLAIGIIALLVLASIHLILKELRDLSGCMLVSLVLSLTVAMIGNLILSATDSRPSAYINLLFLESLVHGSDVAVHFWLSAIGHRAWIAVRYPRKEAMRPEGKRLAFYSLYAWGVAASVTVLAVVVHFFIDDHSADAGISPHSFFTWYRIGWLGLALFCSTSVFLLLVNICVYFSTKTNLSQQTAYGRTFHRNKGYFQTFTRFLIIIEAVWTIQVFAWLQYPVLVGLRVLADIVLPFLIIWAALKGRRVMHLLKIRLQMSNCWLFRRCFSHKNRDRTQYYGEEMMAIGTPI